MFLVFQVWAHYLVWTPDETVLDWQLRCGKRNERTFLNWQRRWNYKLTRYEIIWGKIIQTLSFWKQACLFCRRLGFCLLSIYLLHSFLLWLRRIMYFEWLDFTLYDKMFQDIEVKLVCVMRVVGFRLSEMLWVSVWLELRVVLCWGGEMYAVNNWRRK